MTKINSDDLRKIEKVLLNIWTILIFIKIFILIDINDKPKCINIKNYIYQEDLKNLGDLD